MKNFGVNHYKSPKIAQNSFSPLVFINKIKASIILIKNFASMHRKLKNEKENVQRGEKTEISNKKKINWVIIFLWFCFDFMFIIYNLINIPIEITFKQKFFELNRSFIIIMGVLEIFISFKIFLSYGINKNMLYEEKIWKFITSTFFSDIFSFFFQISHLENPEDFHCFCYFLKVFALNGLFSYFLEENHTIKKAKKIYISVLLWVKYIILMHFLCCILIYFNHDESDISFTNNTYDIYIRTLYFINSNMNIFHCNLHTAKTKPTELLWSLGMNVFSLIFCIYFIKSLLKFGNNNEKNLKKILEKSFLEEKEKEKIIMCYKTNEKKRKGQEALMKLNKTLKNKILFDKYFSLLNKIPFLANNFSKKTLEDLTAKIQEKCFFDKEKIYDEKDSENFYFIFKGEIEVSMKKSINDQYFFIKKLKKNYYFGELSLFSPCNKEEKMLFRSIGRSILISINKNDFLSIVKENDIDFQVYCEIRDQICFSNNFSRLNISCYFCNNNSHETSKCPKLYYKPSPKKVIALSLQNENLFRKSFQRNLKKSKKIKKEYQKKSLCLPSFKKISLCGDSANNKKEINLNKKIPSIENSMESQNIEESNSMIIYQNSSLIMENEIDSLSILKRNENIDNGYTCNFSFLGEKETNDINNIEIDRIKIWSNYSIQNNFDYLSKVDSNQKNPLIIDYFHSNQVDCTCKKKGDYLFNKSSVK